MWPLRPCKAPELSQISHTHTHTQKLRSISNLVGRPRISSTLVIVMQQIEFNKRTNFNWTMSESWAWARIASDNCARLLVLHNLFLLCNIMSSLCLAFDRSTRALSWGVAPLKHFNTATVISAQSNQINPNAPLNVIYARDQIRSNLSCSIEINARSASSEKDLRFSAGAWEVGRLIWHWNARAPVQFRVPRWPLFEQRVFSHNSLSYVNNKLLSHTRTIANVKHQNTKPSCSQTLIIIALGAPLVIHQLSWHISSPAKWYRVGNLMLPGWLIIQFQELHSKWRNRTDLIILIIIMLTRDEW